MYESTSRRASSSKSSIAAFFPDRVETTSSKISRDHSSKRSASDRTYDSHYRNQDERKYQSNSPVRGVSTSEQYNNGYDRSRGESLSSTDKAYNTDHDHRAAYNNSSSYNGTDKYSHQRFDQGPYSRSRRDPSPLRDFNDHGRSYDRNQRTVPNASYDYPREGSRERNHRKRPDINYENRSYRSPERRRDRSPGSKHDRSPDRRRDRSPDRRRDRSPDRRRDRSPDRCRDRSPDRRRDRSPDKRRDRSRDGRHDRDSGRRHEKSRDRNEKPADIIRERRHENGHGNDYHDNSAREQEALRDHKGGYSRYNLVSEKTGSDSRHPEIKSDYTKSDERNHDAIYENGRNVSKNEHQIKNNSDDKSLSAGSHNALIDSSVGDIPTEFPMSTEVKEYKQLVVAHDDKLGSPNLMDENLIFITDSLPTPGCTPPQKHPQPDMPSRKEFRVSYDPDTAKDKTQGTKLVYIFGSQDSKAAESISNTAGDPRRKLSLYPKVSKVQRLPFKALFIPRFSYDSYSLGPKPPSQILISGLSNLTVKQTIARFFKAYGDIEDIELFQDNMTGMSLGLCRIRYKGLGSNAIYIAHQAATRAVNEGGLLKIDMKRIKVQFDDTGELGVTLRDKIMKGRQVDEAISKAPSGPRLLREEKKLSPVPVKEKTTFVEKEIKKEVSLRTQSRIPEEVISSTSLDQRYFHSQLERRIGQKPFIRIKNRHAPTGKLSRADLQKFLRDFDFDAVLNDTAAFYITFKSPRECKECYSDLNGRRFYDHKMYMDLFLNGYAPGKKDFINIPCNTLEKSVAVKLVQKKYKSPLEEAHDIIMRDICDHLMRDIREKVSAPAIFECLDPTKFKKVEDTSPGGLFKSASEQPLDVSTANDETKIQGSLQLLRRFKRKGTDEVDTKKLKKKRMNARSMNHRLNFDYSDDDRDTDVSTRKGTPVVFEQEDDQINNSNISAPQKRVLQKRNHVLYSSSDADETSDTEENKASMDEIITEKADISTGEDLTKSLEKDALILTDEKTGNIAEEEVDDMSQESVDWIPSTGGSKPVYEDDFSLKLDLDGLQDLVKDDEDLELMRLALADVEICNISDHKYWSWRTKEIKSYNHGFTRVGPVRMEKDLYDQFRHSTGSSRSQGYYKVIEAEKSIYLPHRRKIHQPIDTLHVNDKSQDANKGVPSGRLNRANNRRLAADINIHKQTFSSETDIFNFNQLMKRRKPVKFARSAIHNWGLYAIEPIAANEMIIEYVGETVRQQVADMRENRYLSSGIGSSYLFRIDENTVVDATKRGGIARFINHCCTPSCTAKIIKVEGSKRIVIYALRDIAADEELTYDYKFEREQSDDERIVCLCGAVGCKGYLN